MTVTRTPAAPVKAPETGTQSSTLGLGLDSIVLQKEKGNSPSRILFRLRASGDGWEAHQVRGNDGFETALKTATCMQWNTDHGNHNADLRASCHATDGHFSCHLRPICFDKTDSPGRHPLACSQAQEFIYTRASLQIRPHTEALLVLFFVLRLFRNRTAIVYNLKGYDLRIRFSELDQDEPEVVVALGA